MKCNIKKINPGHAKLKTVIKNSIGNPTDEKIESVLFFYKNKGVLIGAFVNEKLIGCCGYEINAKELVVNHLSVIKKFQNNKLGTQLVSHAMIFEDCDSAIAYTDTEALSFYKKMQFQCEKIDSDHSTDRFKCVYLKNEIEVNSDVEKNLQALSDSINEHYGFVAHAGDNFGEPVINSGPCGPFANEFYKVWNSKFKNRVKIAFVMKHNPTECNHIITVLPNGSLYDGGIGVHSEKIYIDKGFYITVMGNYDLELLEQHAYGLDRKYPRYCPDFNLTHLTSIIENALVAIYLNQN